jgi:predicted Fe-Mo cluster-binding NifX family protein
MRPQSRDRLLVARIHLPMISRARSRRSIQIAPRLAAGRNTEEIQMKVAVASDDGTRVSQHFGRAPYYVVFEVQEGRVASREVREKGYHHGAHQHQHGHDGEEPGPHQHGAYDHGSMVSPIGDCDVVLAGGMGAGAYHSLRAQGIEPAFVRADLAEEAVADYLTGRTVDHDLCQH